ncbi:MAG: hypothetical protein HOY69_17710, partial [Streptomyces sp.]|nr:hypothetical protein [Streptomyces sp.]
ATPLGVRPDGALVVSDREAVWALRDGTLTRLYRFPPDRTPSGTGNLVRTARQEGLSGLSAMTLRGMAGGDAESVYLGVRDPAHQYVLRVGRGIVNVVARHRLDGHDYGQDCEKPKPMDARELPCPLPESLAYHGGKPVVGGR